MGFFVCVGSEQREPSKIARQCFALAAFAGTYSSFRFSEEICPGEIYVDLSGTRSTDL